MFDPVLFQVFIEKHTSIIAFQTIPIILHSRRTVDGGLSAAFPISLSGFLTTIGYISWQKASILNRPVVNVSNASAPVLLGMICVNCGVIEAGRLI